MNWKQVECKGKKVWALLNDAGELRVENGLVPIRYSESQDAKMYKASLRNIVEIADAPHKTLKGTASAQKSKKKKTTGLGSAKTRTAEQAQRAQQVAQQMLDSFSEGTVICFTDGSCQRNPGPAGLGVWICLPDGTQKEHYRYLGEATNNIAELSAIEDAISLVAAEERYADAPVAILTDSKYTSGVLTKNWKAKANRPLIQKIKSLLKKNTNIRIHWVAGHAGIEGNEKADALANRAIAEGK
ncbi:MAG: RNase H family protein [Myxococcota bacterium]|nr:RNase H family protein [Myxococcota bacterium]